MSMHLMSISLQPFTANSTNKYSLRSTSASYDRDFIKLLPSGRKSGHWAMNFRPNSVSRPETTGGHDCTVGENDGVIIVDHGSRRQESNLMLHDFVSMFRARTCYNIVEPAHMELAEPTIKEAFGKCVQQGASRVIVSTYFLSPGRHWKQDIPALASEASKEHSGVPYIITAPLGLHELMVVKPMSVRYVPGLESAAFTLDGKDNGGYFARQSYPNKFGNFIQPILFLTNGRLKCLRP